MRIFYDPSQQMESAFEDYGIYASWILPLIFLEIAGVSVVDRDFQIDPYPLPERKTRRPLRAKSFF
jgi:hypothetical protein